MITRADKATWYRLVRRWGQSITLTRTASSVSNITTGVVTPDQDVMTVKRALVLSGTIRPRFIYDIGYLAANKNFTYGGEFSQRDVTIVFKLEDFAKACRLASVTDTMVRRSDRIKIIPATTSVQMTYEINNVVINPGHEIVILHCRDAGDTTGAR